MAHIRHTLWKDAFWKIDLVKKKAYRVSRGSFGHPGGNERALEHLSVKVLPKDDESKPFFSILLFDSVLEYDTALKRVRLTYEGNDIARPDIWQVSDLDGFTYHIKYTPPQSWSLVHYWKIDRSKLKFYRVSGGKFGMPGGNETCLSTTVAVFPSPSVHVGKDIKDIEADDGMTSVKMPMPGSEWISTMKSQYHTLLQSEAYNILVVPFQVEGYAIDRPGRLLMARYLANRIKRTTNKKIPSLTLVAKALGESARSLNDSEIYTLANDLHVEMIIKGYVGHHRDGKMNLTLRVETATQGMFNSSAKSVTIKRQNVTFSNEALPSEAFCKLLDGLMKELPIQITRKYHPIMYRNRNIPRLPGSVVDIAGLARRTPVEEAYYLQLLGMLYPEETSSRDDLFERSLEALQDVAPASPDYQLLKARALFYLYRRPAALYAIKTPRTAAEKALLALLNGDLPQLRAQTKEITEPLLRLMAYVEENDLAWHYDASMDKKNIGALINEFPAWEVVVTRRFHTLDPWDIQENLRLKKELDKTFPISDFTAETLVRDITARGENIYDNADLDFSVYRHWQKLLAHQPEKLKVVDDEVVAGSDYLDLLSAIAEANLVKTAKLRLFQQGLPQEALILLDRYDAVYRGHPETAFLRSNALNALARMNKGLSGESQQMTAEDFRSRACLWSQGQSYPASKACSSSPFYDADFPRRAYWKFLSSFPGNRMHGSSSGPITTSAERQWYLLQNLRESVAYSHDTFEYFKEYHSELLKAGAEKAAKELIQKNKHRFIGSTSRVIYFATLQEQTGNYKEAKKLYEQAIRDNPSSWDLYYQLGILLVKTGQVNKAAEAFNSFPLFNIDQDQGSTRDADTVALSNYAYAAGNYLLKCGAIDKAVPLLQRSVSYKTGSWAEMRNSYLLNTLEKKFFAAAQVAYNTARRYGKADDYSEYIKMLHALGHHKEAWSAWSDLKLAYKPEVDWTSSILAYQMEVRGEKDQVAWLISLDKAELRLSVINAQRYIFLSHLLDRAPNVDTAESIDTIDDRFLQARLRASMQGFSQANVEKKREALAQKPYRYPEARLADAYYHLRLKDFDEASGLFKDLIGSSNKIDKRNRSLLPFFAYSSVKSGKGFALGPYVEGYRKQYGEDFTYYLTVAYQYYGRGNHKEVLNNLENARGSLPGEYRHNDIISSFPPLYQLMEACEWLFEDSQNEVYMARAIEWARLFQNVHPTVAWLYAIEAKLASTKEARLRALAITLYLDPRSERIATFDRNEKDEALVWLQENNPFSVPEEKQINKDAMHPPTIYGLLTRLIDFLHPRYNNHSNVQHCQ